MKMNCNNSLYFHLIAHRSWCLMIFPDVNYSCITRGQSCDGSELRCPVQGGRKLWMSDVRYRCLSVSVSLGWLHSVLPVLCLLRPARSTSLVSWNRRRRWKEVFVVDRGFQLVTDFRPRSWWCASVERIRALRATSQGLHKSAGTQGSGWKYKSRRLRNYRRRRRIFTCWGVRQNHLKTRHVSKHSSK